MSTLAIKAAPNTATLLSSSPPVDHINLIHVYGRVGVSGVGEEQSQEAFALNEYGDKCAMFVNLCQPFMIEFFIESAISSSSR